MEFSSELSIALARCAWAVTKVVLIYKSGVHIHNFPEVAYGGPTPTRPVASLPTLLMYEVNKVPFPHFVVFALLTSV